MHNLRIYLDTEFLDDGDRIHLISIGLVADDGRELYLVNNDAPWDAIRENPWLMTNVVPKLNINPNPTPDLDLWQPKANIADAVKQFLRPPIGYTGVELWAWYAAYDHVVLSQLFGRMLDMPNWIPMWTNDIRQEQHLLGDHPVPPQHTNKHHALYDARHDQYMHRYLLSSGVPL